MNLFSHYTDRERPTFANINMLGKCNARCYFCLGRDIPQYLSGRQDQAVHWSEWKNLERFLNRVQELDIHKVYLTGQNTDALLCKDLHGLAQHIQGRGLGLGLRTNGLLALSRQKEIEECQLETGYSIHSLNDTTNMKIMGTKVPDWGKILPMTSRCRVSTVVCRHNVSEFYELAQFVSRFSNVQHFQVRRISTETRRSELLEDVEAYEQLHNEVAEKYHKVGEFYGAPIYNVCGVNATFWRTVQSSIGSINYFTDGTIANDYFVIKGYTDAIGKPLDVDF